MAADPSRRIGERVFSGSGFLHEVAGASGTPNNAVKKSIRREPGPCGSRPPIATTMLGDALPSTGSQSAGSPPTPLSAECAGICDSNSVSGISPGSWAKGCLRGSLHDSALGRWLFGGFFAGLVPLRARRGPVMALRRNLYLRVGGQWMYLYRVTGKASFRKALKPHGPPRPAVSS
jgi:hypothetical protein